MRGLGAALIAAGVTLLLVSDAKRGGMVLVFVGVCVSFAAGVARGRAKAAKAARLNRHVRADPYNEGHPPLDDLLNRADRAPSPEPTLGTQYLRPNRPAPQPAPRRAAPRRSTRDSGGWLGGWGGDGGGECGGGD